MKFVEDKSNEILGYNNELAHLQTKLEEVQTTVMKWWDNIEETSSVIKIAIP